MGIEEPMAMSYEDYEDDGVPIKPLTLEEVTTLIKLEAEIRKEYEKQKSEKAKKRQSITIRLV